MATFHKITGFPNNNSHKKYDRYAEYGLLLTSNGDKWRYITDRLPNLAKIKIEYDSAFYRNEMEREEGDYFVAIFFALDYVNKKEIKMIINSFDVDDRFCSSIVTEMNSKLFPDSGTNEEMNEEISSSYVFDCLKSVSYGIVPAFTSL